MGALPGTAGSTLVAAVFLVGLAAASAIMAFVPGWRRAFRWGRTHDAPPISRGGFLGVAAAFLIMASGLAGAHVGVLPGFSGFAVVLVGFAAFVAVGIADGSPGRSR